MADAIARLTSALSDRYRIEHEPGAGMGAAGRSLRAVGAGI